ncbi:phosphatase PAP2 family protein [Actinoplanes sp. CA-054009]
MRTSSSTAAGSRRTGVIPRQRAGASPEKTPVGRRRSALRELLLIAALFLAYRAGRLLTATDADQAVAHGRAVWRLERLAHLPSELAVQRAMLGQEWLVGAANSYYAYVHFPATVACLLWLWFRHPGRYRRTRRTLAGLTAAALVLHIAYPLAPPRLVAATGLIDAGGLYGPSVYGPPSTDHLSNQYAAMPSLHVGWAIVVAVAVITAGRGRWRWIAVAHPVTTLLVVVATGHHYWLDAIVVTALLVTGRIGGRIGRARRRMTGA